MGGKITTPQELCQEGLDQNECISSLMLFSPISILAMSTIIYQAYGS